MWLLWPLSLSQSFLWSLYLGTLSVRAGLSSRILKRIKFPPYLEQIVVLEDRLAVLFESGAAAYREKANPVLANVLLLDLATLLHANKRPKRLLQLKIVGQLKMITVVHKERQEKSSSDVRLFYEFESLSVCCIAMRINQ